MNTQVTIIAKDIRSAELKELLQHKMQESNDVALEVRQKETNERGIDPTILVAVVGLASTGLGALITGIWEVAKLKFARMIIIQTAAGSRIEIPVGVSEKEIDRLIKKVLELDAGEPKAKASDKNDFEVLIY